MNYTKQHLFCIRIYFERIPPEMKCRHWVGMYVYEGGTITHTYHNLRVLAPKQSVSSSWRRRRRQVHHNLGECHLHLHLHRRRRQVHHNLGE